MMSELDIFSWNSVTAGETNCLDKAGRPKLMIVGITSSPEPSHHSAVIALPSNM